MQFLEVLWEHKKAKPLSNRFHGSVFNIVWDLHAAFSVLVFGWIVQSLCLCVLYSSLNMFRLGEGLDNPKVGLICIV